jgi:imidazoleglycerol-phosphate dehydratase
MNRTAVVHRSTNETRISVHIDLDGTGAADISTGIGFFDHMLHQIARHACIDLTIKAEGDLHIDDHHTVEDVGISLGRALHEALGDREGIARYGEATVPMDEALVHCALDFSGRGMLVFSLPVAVPTLGHYSTEMTPEFFRALAHNAGLTLHLRSITGSNAHHLVEGAFKAFARALRAAVTLDPRSIGVPSTKGSL